MSWQEEEIKKRSVEEKKRQDEVQLRELATSSLWDYWKKLCQHSMKLPPELRIILDEGFDDGYAVPCLLSIGKGCLRCHINKYHLYPNIEYDNFGSSYGFRFQIIFNAKHRRVVGKHAWSGSIYGDEDELYEVDSPQGIETVVKNTCTGEWMTSGLRLLESQAAFLKKKGFLGRLFGR